jgi:hypothetical protein
LGERQNKFLIARAQRKSLQTPFKTVLAGFLSGESGIRTRGPV